MLVGHRQLWGKDTIRGVLSDSLIMFNGLKAGMYNVMIKAKPPYKNQTLNGISVSKGKLTDIGKVVLSQ